MADQILDCDACKRMSSSDIRSHMACGWMLPSERKGDQFFVPRGAPRPPECPGYLISLPDVREGARALGWKKDGCLRDFYPEGPTSAAMDAIDIIDSEIRSVERHSLREVRKDSNARPGY